MRHARGQVPNWVGEWVLPPAISLRWSQTGSLAERPLRRIVAPTTTSTKAVVPKSTSWVLTVGISTLLEVASTPSHVARSTASRLVSGQEYCLSQLMFEKTLRASTRTFGASPTAYFPTGENCGYEEHFGAHMLIFGLTFCVRSFPHRVS